MLQGSNNPVFNKFTQRNWKVLDALQEVVKQMDRPAAQVALNWVVAQPGITSTIIGATKLQQLESNLEALKFTIPDELRKKLDQASQLEPGHPYMFFEEVLQDRVRGGVKIRKWN